MDPLSTHFGRCVEPGVCSKADCYPAFMRRISSPLVSRYIRWNGPSQVRYRSRKERPNACKRISLIASW